MPTKISPLSPDEATRVLTEAGFPPVGTLEQAAEATGLSVAALRCRYRNGELRALHTAGAKGGKILILRQDLATLLAGMVS